MRKLFLKFMYWSRVFFGKGSSLSSSCVLVPRKGYIKIGCDSIISHFCILDTQNKSINIGDFVSIQSGGVVYGNVVIGNNTRIAAHTVIVASEHNYINKSELIRLQGYKAKGVVIGSDVWVGAGVKILDGAVIGDGCVIGANSVVKGFLAPYGVYVGSPASRIKERI